VRRRAFLKNSLVAATVLAVAPLATNYRCKGKVSATSPTGNRHRAFLNGVEVSKDCTEADDVEGYVVVFIRKDGKLQLTADRSELLQEVKRGTVRIECMKSPCPHCDA
jgi:hypothetical protein